MSRSEESQILCSRMVKFRTTGPDHELQRSGGPKEVDDKLAMDTSSEKKASLSLYKNKMYVGRGNGNGHCVLRFGIKACCQRASVLWAFRGMTRACALTHMHTHQVLQCPRTSVGCK
jgi:hypothetical protein